MTVNNFAPKEANKNRNHNNRHRRNHHKKNQKPQNHTTPAYNDMIIQSEAIYTRNSDPLYEGVKLPNIVLFDANEEELDLHMIKSTKLCISIPTLKNDMFIKEITQLDEITKEFEDLQCFAISNEPVFTQHRLTKQVKLEKFKILSDFKNREYARNTGTYIYELEQLVKAILIIDRNDRIIYARYYDDLISAIDMNEIHEALKKSFR